MSPSDTVRDAQRRLGELDAAHRRALAKLDRAKTRRSEVAAHQDTLVGGAQAGVDRTVVAMATEIGIDLTSSLLGLNSTDVRHLVRAARPCGDDFGTVGASKSEVPRLAGLNRRARPDGARGETGQ